MLTVNLSAHRVVRYTGSWDNGRGEVKGGELRVLREDYGIVGVNWVN
jgi:hypothetical protein